MDVLFVRLKRELFELLIGIIHLLLDIEQIKSHAHARFRARMRVAHAPPPEAGNVASSLFLNNNKKIFKFFEERVVGRGGEGPTELPAQGSRQQELFSPSRRRTNSLESWQTC